MRVTHHSGVNREAQLNRLWLNPDSRYFVVGLKVFDDTCNAFILDSSVNKADDVDGVVRTQAHVGETKHCRVQEENTIMVMVSEDLFLKFSRRSDEWRLGKVLKATDQAFRSDWRNCTLGHDLPSKASVTVPYGYSDGNCRLALRPRLNATGGACKRNLVVAHLSTAVTAVLMPRFHHCFLSYLLRLKYGSSKNFQYCRREQISSIPERLHSTTA